MQLRSKYTQNTHTHTHLTTLYGEARINYYHHRAYTTGTYLTTSKSMFTPSNSMLSHRDQVLTAPRCCHGVQTSGIYPTKTVTFLQHYQTVQHIANSTAGKQRQ